MSVARLLTCQLYADARPDVDGPAPVSEGGGIVVGMTGSGDGAGVSTELYGTWVHSHEEDADGLEVYRPAGFPFPPARGRSSFTLGPDGAGSTGSPGPVDRGTQAPAQWELAGTELSVLPVGDTAVAPERFDVVAIEPERLTLRPTSRGGQT